MEMWILILSTFLTFGYSKLIIILPAATISAYLFLAAKCNPLLGCSVGNKRYAAGETFHPPTEDGSVDCTQSCTCVVGMRTQDQQ